VFAFNAFEVFFRLSDVEIIESDHHIEIEKIVALNNHLLLPDFSDIIPCVELK
jgi:hypothetical protein